MYTKYKIVPFCPYHFVRTILSATILSGHRLGFGHITDVLHWLPVQQRIHYRISSIAWRCVLGNAPSYLLEFFTLTSACSGRRSLRSATKGDFVVPRVRTATR